jgi:predicted  nucleic acid-binding Zn-ribbon protein
MESNANAAENGDEFDETRQLEIEAELEDVCLESDSITATLDVLEEHLDHVENKISQIKSEIKAFDMEQV